MLITIASDWWTSQSPEQQAQYIQDHPDSKYAQTSGLKALPRALGKALSNRAIKGKRRALKALSNTKTSVANNLQNLDDILNPDIVSTDEQKQRAKDAVILVAKAAAIVALAGLVASGQGPLVKLIAEEFWEHLNPLASTSSASTHPDTVSEMYDKVAVFMGTLDRDELLSKLENK